MSTAPPRVPPRFVPTLTEVVQAPAGQGAAAPISVPKTQVTPAVSPTPAAAERTSGAPLERAGTASAPSAPAAPAVPAHAVQPARATAGDGKGEAISPARFAHAATAPAAGVGIGRRPVPPRPAATPLAPMVQAKEARTDVRSPARSLPEGTEEYMVHRVMQRVDVVLDQRLREAIATVVQEQTRSVLPRLREEIESVVRHAVYEAVADELASGHSDLPKG